MSDELVHKSDVLALLSSLGDEAEIQLCMPRPIYCPDCGQALDWNWSEEE